MVIAVLSLTAIAVAAQAIPATAPTARLVGWLYSVSTSLRRTRSSRSSPPK